MAGDIQQVVDLIARPVEADTVLDYGCGDGHLFSYFIGQLSRTKLVGYDPDPKLLSQAPAQFQRALNSQQT
jgi:ribosomal protein L11 methylase PrmA